MNGLQAEFQHRVGCGGGGKGGIHTQKSDSREEIFRAGSVFMYSFLFLKPCSSVTHH